MRVVSAGGLWACVSQQILHLVQRDTDPMAVGEEGHMVLMFVPGRDYRPPAMARAQLNNYYFRVGDQFHPVHPDFLAQMLGVKAPPMLEAYVPMIRGFEAQNNTVAFRIHVRNTGRGVAERPYVVIDCEAARVDRTGQYVTLLQQAALNSDLSGRSQVYSHSPAVIISGKDTYLPPGGMLDFGTIHVVAKQDPAGKIRDIPNVRLTLGDTSSVPRVVEVVLQPVYEDE